MPPNIDRPTFRSAFTHRASVRSHVPTPGVRRCICRPRRRPCRRSRRHRYHRRPPTWRSSTGSGAGDSETVVVTEGSTAGQVVYDLAGVGQRLPGIVQCRGQDSAADVQQIEHTGIDN